MPKTDIIPETPASEGGNQSEAHGAVLNHARLLGGNWRTGRKNIRALVRNLVVAVKIDSYDADDLLGEAKDAMSYRKMDKADQRGFITMTRDLRTILGGWRDLPQSMRDDFIASKEPAYSTLAADIRKAEAAKQAEAEAEAEKERLAELGITPEEAALAEQREADSNANVAAVERVLALLAAESFDEAEGSAVLRLIDGVAAFSAPKEQVAA